MILRPIFTVFSLSKRNSHYCSFSRWCSLPDLSVRHTALGKTLLKILPNYWDVSIWDIETSKPYPSCWYLAHHETCRSSACPSWDMQAFCRWEVETLGTLLSVEKYEQFIQLQVMLCSLCLFLFLIKLHLQIMRKDIVIWLSTLI